MAPRILSNFARDPRFNEGLQTLARRWKTTLLEHVLADDFQGTRDCKLGEVKIRFFGDNLAIAYGSESQVKTSKDGKDSSRPSSGLTPGSSATGGGRSSRPKISSQQSSPPAQRQGCGPAVCLRLLPLRLSARSHPSPSASAGGAAPPLAEFLEWTFPNGRPHLAALRRLSASSHSPRSARRVLSERATHPSGLRKTSASRGSPSRSLLSETYSHALRSPRTSLRSHRERVHQCARWVGTPSHARGRWPASDVRVPPVGTEEVAV